ncbi:MAG: LPS translocon maturation chaperone LptM [Nevskiales bacterium]
MTASRLLPLLFAAWLLAACGQKGDLYLPEQSAPQQENQQR